jgi:predicted SAM-dependent methyltransferase
MDRHELLDRAILTFNHSQRRLEVRRKGRAEPQLPAAVEPHALAIERRLLFAQLYLAGEGLEIGALDSPQPLPAGARVRYVDRLTVEELRTHYPGLDIVDVDLVEDGERLPSIPPSSQDFIIANHFLEHCEDPIGTLQTLTSRVRPGGVLLMSVPDADQTFDAKRPSTPWEHLVEDHEQGAERSRRAHYEEWVRLVDGVEEAEASEHAGRLVDMGYSIHFHVWRLHDLLDFFTRCIDEVGVPLTLEAVARFGIEAICVLRRTEAASREA